MRRYSEAVKADVRRRMSPPQRQSVAQISEELGIHVADPPELHHLLGRRSASSIHGAGHEQSAVGVSQK